MKKDKKTIHNPLVEFKYDDRLIGKSSDAKIYRNTTLLTPGTFSDSLTMAGVRYDKDLLKNTVDNWHSNYLNIDHSHEVLKRIGRVTNTKWMDNKVKADLYIYPVTKNARDTIKLIDQGLINWLSVEIMTEDGWDKSDERFVKDLEYLGVAVVTEPACKEAKIDDEGPEFDPPV